MPGAYVYHHIKQSNRGYPYLFTIRAPESHWRPQGEREKIVAEVIKYVEAEFGGGGQRWMYSPDTDIFRFSNEQDAFLFRLRWA